MRDPSHCNKWDSLFLRGGDAALPKLLWDFLLEPLSILYGKTAAATKVEQGGYRAAKRYAPTGGVAVGRGHTVQPPSEWDRQTDGSQHCFVPLPKGGV